MIKPWMFVPLGGGTPPPPPPPATNYIFSPRPDSDHINPGWIGDTMRFVIPTADLKLDATSFRLKFEYSTFNWGFAKCYVGTVAATGDAYDFAATPTQVLFSGGAAGSVTAGGLISDEIAVPLDKTKKLLISLYFNDGATDDVPWNPVSNGGYEVYYKLADDAATVDATGYSTSSCNGHKHAIEAIFSGAVPDWYSPIMTSDSLPSPYITLASSVYAPGNYEAFRAMNANQLEFWNSAANDVTGAWWALSTGTDGPVRTDVLYIKNMTPYGFHTFKFQGSNDISWPATNWSDIYSGSCADNSNIQVYSALGNTTFYKHYRLLCLSGYDGTYLVVYKFWMYGVKQTT